MSNILVDILAHKRHEVAEARRGCNEQSMAQLARQAPAPRDFIGMLRRPRQPLSVIAEIKAASPSAGPIRPGLDPAQIARQYQAAGAAAISCLTDRKYFGGGLADIQIIRSAVDLPVLRKDFILETYQVHESRTHGADAILLIAECLKDEELTQLSGLAAQLGMAALVEVHEAENLDRVLKLLSACGARNILVGINNRDLRAMTTDLDHTLRLLDRIPDKSLVVSESGIRSHADIQKLAGAGVTMALVGEHLLKQPDPGQALKELLGGT